MKIFPPGSHGILGEHHGWTYHQTAGLPCASNAAIILIPIKKLRHYHPECKWLFERQDEYWSGWASEIPTRAARPFTKAKQIQALRDEKHILGLIALREALHDIDSHINNFIPLNGSMMAVDFSESFGGQNFKLSDLSSVRWIANKLAAEVLAESTPETWQALQNKGDMLYAAWKENEPHLRMWRDRLIMEQADRNALADFLLQRMNTKWSMKEWA